MSTTDPGRGATTHAYDGAGRVTRRTDARGTAVHLIRDASSRSGWARPRAPSSPLTPTPSDDRGSGVMTLANDDSSLFEQSPVLIEGFKGNGVVDRQRHQEHHM